MITVEVETTYIEEHSVPKTGHYVFSYTVSLCNNGNSASTLLSRHWIITNGNGQQEEVRGTGVIGEQPRLQPGERFQYTSGTVLATPVGSMRGSYRFADDNGLEFDVEIPAFTLSTPHTLN